MNNEINRQSLDNEMDAIELGLNALSYMLRKTHALTQDLSSILAHDKVPLDAKAFLPGLQDQGYRVLVNARNKISELMESVGDYRNNTDACTDIEEFVTGPAFTMMRDLAKPVKLPVNQPI